MLKQSTPRRSVLRYTVLAAAVLITAAACSESKSPGSSGGSNSKTFTIGVGQCDTGIPFLATLDKAIEAEANKHGMKTVILNGKLDNALQAENILTLVAKKVDLILVTSCSPTAVVPAIKKAREAGIPVFAVNAKLDPTAEVITYIGASDFDMGVSQGQMLVKALPAGGKIAVILGPLGDTPQVQRLAGLKSVLKDHPNIEIVATPTDGFDNAKNLAVTQDLLTKYPAGTLNAIVAQGPQMYIGANYAQKQGRKDLLFFAADYSIQVEAAIKSGSISGTIDQSPTLEGQLAAKYAHDWLTGNEAGVPKPEFLIPVPAITKDNVDTNPATWSS